jgi:hypothetical protein
LPGRRTSSADRSCGECCGPSSKDGSSKGSSRSTDAPDPSETPKASSAPVRSCTAQANGCVRARGFAGRRPRRFGARAGKAESSPHTQSCESRDQTACRAITRASCRGGRTPPETAYAGSAHRGPPRWRVMQPSFGWHTTGAGVPRARAPAVCCASHTSTRPSAIVAVPAAITAGTSNRWQPTTMATAIAQSPRSRGTADASQVRTLEVGWRVGAAGALERDRIRGAPGEDHPGATRHSWPPPSASEIIPRGRHGDRHDKSGRTIAVCMEGFLQ